MLTPEDHELLKAFSKLSPEQRTAALNFLRVTDPSKPSASQDNSDEIQETDFLLIR